MMLNAVAEITRQIRFFLNESIEECHFVIIHFNNVRFLD